MKTPRVVLVNPARVTTGTGFVMPAAQVTLAGAIPANLDVEPIVIDETITRFNPNLVRRGDIVCVSALTNTCREAYRVVAQAKLRGATVVVGGPHPTLLSQEALLSGADVVVRGEGDTIFGQVLEDIFTNQIPANKIYQDPSGQPFQVPGDRMAYPRLDLVDVSRYSAASLRSTAGCRESCTFCTVPTIGGKIPRERPVEMVAREVRELHDRGIRFVIWGADNLVQIPLSVVRSCRNPAEIKLLEAERERSLVFFHQFAKLTGAKRVWGFAQLTLRLSDDPEMLEALSKDGAICAALFGIESVDPEALRRMAKGWNGTREEMIEKIQRIESAGIHVLGSMIVGLPTDTPETIAAMRSFSRASGMSVAQFPIYEILPGSPDYNRARREFASQGLPIVPRATVKLLRDNYWLDEGERIGTPHLEHPTLSEETMRSEGLASWHYFYTFSHLLRNALRRHWPWRRVLTYVVVCKGFARFYGGSVGLSADNVRTKEASFFQRRLMAFGAWLMHHAIPSPPAVSHSADTAK